ncbi:hypothetical protein Hdeb2414_s0009g00324081 [Helianthus debilis subsp. tardiflorus]
MEVMSALDFIKSDDTSDVMFTDVVAAKGDDVVVRGSKHRFEGLGYVNVHNIKGFVKVSASKASTRCSTRRKGVRQPSSSETVDLSDDLEVSDDVEVSIEGKKGELPLVVCKDNKAVGKKVGGLKPSGKAIEVPLLLTQGKFICLVGRLLSLIVSNPCLSTYSFCPSSCPNFLLINGR